MSDQKGAFNNSKKVSVICLFVYAYTSKISTLFHTHKAQFFSASRGCNFMAKGNKCKVYISKLILLQVMVKFEGERGTEKSLYWGQFFWQVIIFPGFYTCNDIRLLFLWTPTEAWQDLHDRQCRPLKKKWKYRENIMVALRLVQSIQNTLSLAKMGDHNTHLSKGP